MPFLQKGGGARSNEIGREKPMTFILCSGCAKKIMGSAEEVEDQKKMCGNCKSRSKILWKISNLGFFCPSCTPDLIRKIEEIAKIEEIS